VHLAEFPDLDMNMMRAHFLLQFQPEFFVFWTSIAFLLSPMIEFSASILRC
jgi:hypothetical protein